MTISEHGPVVSRQEATRIPNPNGEFELILYGGGSDNKEHMALVIGEVSNRDDVLIRLHSECFTGDVLGSLRCDCGEQLSNAMQAISAEGSGIILYLRQEGRGIGLREKLRAYNLQDLGHDTVDANLALGHEVDARDYTVAAQILRDLGVSSVRVLTNNPLKIAALKELGIAVTRRVPIEIIASPDNLSYLRTKVSRMSHLLRLNGRSGIQLNENGTVLRQNGNGIPTLEQHSASDPKVFTRPAVTLSYAQSVDGSIARANGDQVLISGKQSMMMTHRLRASHDAILVGIGTALMDNPRLTVRLVPGDSPQPVVVDSHLRLSPDAALFTQGRGVPLIATTERHDPDHRRALEDAGATIIPVRATREGLVDLGALLDVLESRGISSLMVEGGSSIIRSFLRERLVDNLVITVSPRLIGGLRVLGDAPSGDLPYPRIENVHYQRLGDDMVLWGRPRWETA